MNLNDPLSHDEKQKYESIWGFDSYRRYAPAERHLDALLARWQPTKGESIIDVGAGTGRAAMKLHQMGYGPVLMIDIAANCLDREVFQYLQDLNPDNESHFGFYQGCLWEMLPGIAQASDWFLCVDVMEHIPTQRVANVLSWMSNVKKGGVFRIATRPDVHGKKIGQPLHLTVQTGDWWIDMLGQYFTVESHTIEKGAVEVFVKTNRESKEQ